MSRFLNTALLATLVAAAPLSGVVPIHYFPFDGNTVDVNGGAATQVFGAPTYVPGRTSIDFGGQETALSSLALDQSNLAIQLNGTTDFIRAFVDINPSSLPDLTMGAWVMPSTVAPSRQIISHDSGGFDRSLGLDGRGGGTGWSAFTGAGVLGVVPAEVGVWQFVAVVYDGETSTTRLYVYNESSGVTEIRTGGFSNSAGWTYSDIGHNPSFGEFFGGAVDDVFFFDEALTDTQLEQVRINGPEAVPEASTVVLVTLGAAMCLGWGMLRRRRSQS
ncbi:MAG: LamG domain-containing protein [Verrucomicrobiota bacterium]